jgi:hypothetical protein
LGQEVTEVEGGVAEVRGGRLLAALGVAGLAVVMSLLPVLVALGVASTLDTTVLAGLAASLALAAVGAKFLAAAWGLHAAAAPIE